MYHAPLLYYPHPATPSLLEQVHIVSPRCQADSCENFATCGFAEDGVRRFCVKHKQAGMVRT